MQTGESDFPTPTELTLFVLHSDRLPFMFGNKRQIIKTMNHEDTLIMRQIAYADLRL